MKSNQGRNTDDTVALRDLIDSELADLHTALPGRVKAYNAAKQRATVEVALKRLIRPPDSEPIEILVKVSDVPVIFPRSGGFSLTFPVSVDDPCLVIFLERDAGGWLLNGQTQVPPTRRRHNFSDAVAIMGLAPGTQPITPSPSTTATQLRNAANTKRVEVSASGVSSVSDARVDLQAGTAIGVTASTSIDLTAGVNVTLTAGALLTLIATGALVLQPTGAFTVVSTGAVTITRGANELMAILSDALDKIGTSTAAGAPLSNAAQIATLKGKIDTMRT